jgi:transcriptional regulator with XRE-family HTH domain
MDTPETNLFGDLLKSFRQRRKLTQSALAYKIEKHSRGSIQAWEGNLYLPGDRETVLALTRALQLTESETDKLFLAANYAQEYHTQGISFSADEKGEHLYVVDTYIDECGYIPVKIVIFYNEPRRLIEAKPVLLSVPPVGIDSIDVWTSLLTPCAEQNKATLRRMSVLSANTVFQ